MESTRCGLVCVKRWKDERSKGTNNKHTSYCEWLQVQIYRYSNAIDLCEVLHSPASKGHDECLEKLLDLGFCPNEESQSPVTTPLIEAAKAGSVKCVQLLMNAGAQVDHQALDNSTALMHAVISGHLSCTMALASVADVNITCKLLTLHEESALSLAAANGELKIFKLLLKSTSSSMFKTYQSIRWLLDLISWKPYNYVNCILDAIIEEFGGVPMFVYEHLAFENKFLVLRHLVTKRLPLMGASGRRADVRKLLYTCVESPESGVCCLNELLTAKHEIGLDLTKYNFDCTLLQYSCEMLNHQALQLLLSHGVDVNAPSLDSFETPLKECIRSTLRDPRLGMKCLSLLIKYGCAVEKRFKAACLFPAGEYWVSPLEYALSGKNLYAARMLLVMYDRNERPRSPHLTGTLREEILPYHVQCCRTELNDFVSKIASPFRLVHIARVRIRKQIGCNPHAKIYRLPIPHNMKRCLELSDLDDLLHEFEDTIAKDSLSLSDDSDD